MFKVSQEFKDIRTVMFAVGRASGAPTLDMFITLLSMGSGGFKTLLSRLPYPLHNDTNCLISGILLVR